MNENSINKLCVLLEKENWENTLSNKNNPEMDFLLTLEHHLNNSCPYKQPNRKEQKQAPWMTMGILMSGRSKHKLHKDMIKERTPRAIEKFRKYNKIYNSVIKNAKKKQLALDITTAGNNSKLI